MHSMTTIPFLPRAEVAEVLEREHDYRASEGEMLAEYGASAFALYGNSGDAMIVAHAMMERDRDEYVDTPAWLEYKARVETAHFMARASEGLRVRTVYEDGYFELYGAAVVPEFIPGVIPSRQFFGEFALTNDIPF